MKNLFVLLFLGVIGLYSVPSLSQTDITGSIVNASNEGVVYASVSLLETDLSFVNSAISSPEGNFKFIDVTAGTYLLRVDHMEYDTYTSAPITVASGNPVVIPTITLQSSINTLGEVVVTKKKPLIEVRADKLIYNVASSPSASGTNGLDLLKKSPGVTIDIDNSISILGKGNVQVYLNGVQSRLSGNDLTTFLQSLTSDIVNSIEIISNPSSKYDAEGTGGIINIRLKKNVSVGFNGNATSSFTKGLEFKSSNNVSLNFGSELIKTNIDITQSTDNEPEFFDDKKFQNDALLYLQSEELRVREGYNIGFGAESQLSDNHFVSFSARGILNDNESDLESTTNIYTLEPEELSEILFSESIAEGTSSNYIGNLNHFWNTSKTSTLSTNISAGIYDTERNTFQPNTYFEPDGSTVITTEDSSFDANTQIDLWSAKMDYEKEWEGVTLSTGAKYAHVITKNQFAFFNFENNEPIFDPTKSNDFNYTENVAAFYASINFKIGNSVVFNGGLRVENTDSRGQLLSEVDIENKDVKRNYTDYFPNVGMSFDHGEDHTWSINIGRRITRPNYQDLNPFESPTSQLVVWKGNPFLKPNYIMNYQASYTFQQKLIVTASYSKTTDFFARIVEIVEGNNTQIIPRNMEKSINYGISASFPIEVTKFWELVAYGDVNRQTFEGDVEGTIIDLDRILWNYQIQNNLKLPYDILMDVSYRQRSEWIWRGSVYIEGTQSLNFGIRKDFMDDRIQIRLTGVDILRTNSDYPYNSNYGGIDLQGTYTDDGRRFGIGVTFKFGDPKAKAKKTTKSALDEELNRI